MIYGYSLILKENYLNMLYESLYPEALDEGANIEMTKIFKDLTKKYKEYLKSSKKALKEKDFDKAKSQLTQAKKIVKKLENQVRSIDASDSGSVTFGFLSGIALSFIQYFTVSFGGTYGAVGATKAVSDISKAGEKLGKKITKAAFKKTAAYAPAVGATFSSIVVTYQTIQEIKNRYDEAIVNGTSTNEAFNLYKTKLLEMINKFYNNIDEAGQRIIAQEKREYARILK